MPNPNNSNEVLSVAQAQAHAAMELSAKSGVMDRVDMTSEIGQSPFYDVNDEGVVGEASVQTHADDAADKQFTSLNYVDYDIEPSDTKASGMTSLTANTKSKQGWYTADIITAEGETTASAHVWRDGNGGHQFGKQKKENVEKAAALITKLAAKQIGRQAIEHLEPAIEARDKYLKTVDVKDKSGKAQTIEVHVEPKE